MNGISRNSLDDFMVMYDGIMVCGFPIIACEIINFCLR
jgi:hypothetical protein